MKKNLPSGFRNAIQKFLFLLFAISGQFFFGSSAQAQIYEPEGLNMPGAWNAWTNPPTNNLALASSTQVAGGRITKISVGTLRWQTILSVAATGGDVIGGTYNWLFTSGPSGNAFANKWANSSVVMNTLQSYTYQGSTDNSVTLIDNKWYTINWEDAGYINSRAIFMETSAQPVNISFISVPAGVIENTAATITVSTVSAKSAEEIIYIRYTTDAWITSIALPVTMSGINGSVQLPGQPAGTTVSYYAFSSTVSSLTTDFDLCTINLLNNGGLNYSYTVAASQPVITWANLQFPESGSIETGQTFNVFGQVLIPGVTGQSSAAPGMEAWVGYSTANTNPETWTNWVQATYNGAAGNNDEWTADLGVVIAVTGTYYYATRYKLNADAYVYGGYNSGFWDGITNVSGTLIINDPAPTPDFDWVNVQFPAGATIEPAQELIVYAQAYINGLTGQPTPAPGVQSWIGFSATDTNPDTWTDWIPAPYIGPVGNNDEFSSNLGEQLLIPGTYYYASRFQLNTGDYYYGGYSDTGGGFWNGISNISGVVQVNAAGSGIDWANLQFPGSDTIAATQDFEVFAQAYINGITGQPNPAPGLQGWIGYSETNSDPATWTNWVPSIYNTASGNNDEFKANIGPQFTQEGIWYYASRFQLNSNEYVYGGYNASGGGFWDEINNKSGILTVTATPATYPVLFTIIDGTLNNTNIKFKGEVTNWDTVSMYPNNHTWTLSLNLAPGTYEWGAIEDDGSPNGIWLIEGPNLVMTVGDQGAISGTVTYTTLITELKEAVIDNQVYPNPATGNLFIKTSQIAVIRLATMQGVIVLDQKIGSGTQMIDISGCKPGIYYLEINTGGSKKFHKVIVK